MSEPVTIDSVLAALRARCDAAERDWIKAQTEGEQDFARGQEDAFEESIMLVEQLREQVEATLTSWRTAETVACGDQPRADTAASESPTCTCDTGAVARGDGLRLDWTLHRPGCPVRVFGWIRAHSGEAKDV